MTIEMNNGEAGDGARTDVDRLALLQEVDQRLRSTRIALDLLEQEIRAREQQLAETQEQVRSLRAAREGVETRRIEAERRLDEEGAAMKERRMRLNRVRTERELQAVRREIELGKEATQQLEAELLACMEQLETNGQELATAEAALAELEEPVTQEIAERRERLSSLERSVAEDAKLRERLAARLNLALRSKYEQIFARRGGLAVVAVLKGTCQGCHMHVPPQLFNEIQKVRDVRQCPNCHRLLFWRPEATAEASSDSTR